MFFLCAIGLMAQTLGQITIRDQIPVVVPGPVCAAEDAWSLAARDPFTGRDGSDLLAIGPEGYFEASCGNIVLPTDVLFDFNRSELKPEALPILRAVAEHLATVKDVYYIDGHCDTVGTEAYNYNLGLRRANAVMNALVELGISSGRFIPRSFGKERPIASNDTEAGRARNRRVELIRLNLDILPRERPSLSETPDEAGVALNEEPAPPVP